MTVRTQPLTDTPEVTEVERRARILEAAALEIEVRGWAQGVSCDDHGRVCLMGAIDVCRTMEMDWFGVASVWDPDWRRAFPHHHDGALMPWALWNDQRERTASEVTHLLRWRAQELRDLEGATP